MPLDNLWKRMSSLISPSSKNSDSQPKVDETGSEQRGDTSEHGRDSIDTQDSPEERRRKLPATKGSTRSSSESDHGTATGSKDSQQGKSKEHEGRGPNLAVQTSSASLARPAKSSLTSSSVNPNFNITPATPLTATPSKSSESSKSDMSGSRPCSRRESEAAPASPSVRSASPDDMRDDDIPGIPQSGSPLPMDEEEDEDEHSLRDAAEAQLEAEAAEESRNTVSSPPPPRSTGMSSRPNAMSSFPQRSILQRLPSQALVDTPSTDAGSPQSIGFPSLSRDSSLKGPKSSSSPRSSAFSSRNPSSSNIHGDRLPQSKSSNSISSPTSNSAGEGSSSGLSRKSQTKKTSDYGFPSTKVVDPPDSIEEDEQQPEQQSSVASPPSERSSNPNSAISSTSASSPPSSTFLEASRQRLCSPRQDSSSSRQNSTSSQHSHQSVNEYSTPAGFLRQRRNSSQYAPKDVKETLNATSRDLPDGKRKLNQYILTRDIGRGSFGVVQIAYDEGTGKEYAIKEFSKARLRKRAQSEMLRRQGRGAAMRRGAVPFRRRASPSRPDTISEGKEQDEEEGRNDLDLIRSEVAIMKKLDHPNVVQLYEVLDVREDDSLFMVVELCANGPLMTVGMGQHVEPVDEEDARNYFRQIVLAIEYLHFNGVIHRDIKPENILKMQEAHIVKLVDFGVSEIFDKENVDDPRELKTGGSPAFMSPELCVSHHGKVSGKAADIWALGVTLYSMVVGYLPFESNQMLDLYEKIRNDPVKIPKELSEDLKDLLKQLLEKDPEKRIQMPALKKHSWVTIEGQDPLPCTDVNVSSLSEVTEDDIDNAIAVPSVSYIVNAVRAASRWKRYAARRTLSEGGHSTEGSVGSGSTDMSRAGSVDTNAKPNNNDDTSGRTSLDHGASPAPWIIANIGERSRKGSAAAFHLPPSSHEPDIQHAASFPMSNIDNEKDPAGLSPQKRGQPAPIGNIVDFPGVNTLQSHHDYLSKGIDDSNVETLRFYEDQTGHLLPRNAIHPNPSKGGG